MPTPDPILDTIEAFLIRHGLTATTFGKVALKDPRFVFDLRDGRECRRATRDRAVQFMREYRPSTAPQRAA